MTKKPSPTELKRIYIPVSSAEAHVVCGRLQDLEIDAKVVGDSLESLHGNLGYSAASEIWVPAQQFDQAKTMLHEWGLSTKEDSPDREANLSRLVAAVFAIVLCATLALSAIKLKSLLLGGAALVLFVILIIGYLLPFRLRPFGSNTNNVERP